MSVTPASELSIATADGAGAGRFLTLALLDALSGSSLAAIRVQTISPAPGTWAIDFGFYLEPGAQAEVIRAGLNPSGVVVSAELLRTGPEVARRFRSQSELAEALVSGHAIRSIHLETQGSGRPSAIVVGLASAPAFTIDMSAFDRLLNGA